VSAISIGQPQPLAEPIKKGRLIGKLHPLATANTDEEYLPFCGCLFFLCFLSAHFIQKPDEIIEHRPVRLLLGERSRGRRRIALVRSRQ